MFGLIELKSVSQKVIMNIEMLFAQFFPSEKRECGECIRYQVCFVRGNKCVKMPLISAISAKIAQNILSLLHMLNCTCSDLYQRILTSIPAGLRLIKFHMLLFT